MAEDEKYIVRLYDVFDEMWIDVCDPTTKEDAERIYNKETNNGTQYTKFKDLAYYKIFQVEQEH